MTLVDTPTRSQRFGWVVCLLLSMVAVRGIALIGLADSYADDPDAYRRIAWTLDQSGTFGLKFGDGDAKPTAYRPPLYPWVLSWLVTDADDADASLPAIRVGLLHWFAFAITLWAVYQTGVRLLDRRAAVIACGLVTLDPLLIRHSALVMTETIAVMLTSLAVWCFVVMVQPPPTDKGLANDGPPTSLQHWTPWGLAVLLAIDFLCRPTFLVWAGFLAIACIWNPRFRRPAIAITLIMAVTVGLWTMRNVRAVGHPVWATTHGGYTMLLSNNRFFYDYLGDGWSWTAWDAGPFTSAYTDRHQPSAAEQTVPEQIVAGQNGALRETALQKTWHTPASIPPIRYEDGEVANDHWAGNVAKETIRQNPGRFAWSSIIRVLRLWSPIPLWTPNRSTTSILVVAAFYFAIYLAIAVAIARHGRRLFQFSWLPIWTLALALTMVHSIYWTNLRMRCPVQPGIALLAAAAFVRGKESGQNS